MFVLNILILGYLNDDFHMFLSTDVGYSVLDINSRASVGCILLLR